MQFHIKCATFIRLASVCNFFEPTTNDEIREKLTTVRLENHKGKTIAIACNHKIAAIEIVNQNPALEDGVAHVVIDPVLLHQCQAEAFLDGFLTVTTTPELALATASTSSGWQFQGNACHWFDDTPMDDWREWAPSERISSDEGIMYWNLHHLETLLKASPSGKVYFPEFVDVTKPIVLRDRDFPHWVGLFVPKPHDEVITTPATLPEWWSK